MIILQNLTTTSHRKGGESKYDRNIKTLCRDYTIRYRVNEVLFSQQIFSLLTRMDENTRFHTLLMTNSCELVSTFNKRPFCFA